MPGRVHELKTWPAYFQSILAGKKTAELRKNDRNFKAGDSLFLQEWDPRRKIYTGAALSVEITHVLRKFPGLRKGYVLLSFKRIWVGNEPDIKKRLDDYSRLVHKLEKYLDIVGEDLAETAIIASVHGWASKRIEQGKKMRREIFALRRKIDGIID